MVNLKKYVLNMMDVEYYKEVLNMEVKNKKNLLFQN